MITLTRYLAPEVGRSGDPDLPSAIGAADPPTRGPAHQLNDSRHRSIEANRLTFARCTTL